MELKKFIKNLQKISEEVGGRETEIQMVDTVPVAQPILKDGIVYITDVKIAES